MFGLFRKPDPLPAAPAPVPPAAPAPAPARPRYEPPHPSPRPPGGEGDAGPYVRYAEHLALRLREHWAAPTGAVPPGEREAFVGGLRELLETRIEPGDAPATVHRRVQWLKAFGLPPMDAEAVLGRSAAVEAYFAERQVGAHLFDADGMCVVCLRSREQAARFACTPARR